MGNIKIIVNNLDVGKNHYNSVDFDNSCPISNKLDELEQIGVNLEKLKIKRKWVK